MICLGVIVLALALFSATALKPYENFNEGSCSEVPQQPIEGSRKFLDTLKYIVGGNKGMLYSFASTLPNYSSISEDEFYYDSCYTRNTSTAAENITGGFFGFGKLILTFQAKTRPGIYFEGTDSDPSHPLSKQINTLTLTDHKSFAFLTSCWVDVDQKSWGVVALTPWLDENTRKIIEEHAVSLGYNRENFVFLRHDSCRQGLGNPSLGIEG